MILTLKLLLTPCLIASVSLIERRWGTAASGWFMGFPFISAPISIVLALQFGPDFAAHSAVGTLGGLTSVCVFCLVYTVAAQKTPWPASLALAITGFLLTTAGWNAAPLPPWSIVVIDAVALGLVLRLIPRRPVPGGVSRLPQWELPVRMALAALFVWLLTTSATALGPSLSGLLAPFPVMISVVAPFTHHRHGPATVAQLLRGVVMGLFSFGSFYIVLATLLPSQPIAWAYAAAAAASILASGLALRFVSPPP
jgi:hypothetical protein